MKNETVFLAALGFIAGTLFAINISLMYISRSLDIIASPPVTETKSE